MSLINPDQLTVDQLEHIGSAFLARATDMRRKLPREEARIAIEAVDLGHFSESPCATLLRAKYAARALTLAGWRLEQIAQPLVDEVRRSSPEADHHGLLELAVATGIELGRRALRAE